MSIYKSNERKFLKKKREERNKQNKSDINNQIYIKTLDLEEKNETD